MHLRVETFGVKQTHYSIKQFPDFGLFNLVFAFLAFLHFFSRCYYLCLLPPCLSLSALTHTAFIQVNNMTRGRQEGIETSQWHLARTFLCTLFLSLSFSVHSLLSHIVFFLPTVLLHTSNAVTSTEMVNCLLSYLSLSLAFSFSLYLCVYTSHFFCRFHFLFPLPFFIFHIPFIPFSPRAEELHWQ